MLLARCIHFPVNWQSCSFMSEYKHISDFIDDKIHILQGTILCTSSSFTVWVCLCTVWVRFTGFCMVLSYVLCLSNLQDTRSTHIHKIDSSAIEKKISTKWRAQNHNGLIHIFVPQDNHAAGMVLEHSTKNCQACNWYAHMWEPYKLLLWPRMGVLLAVICRPRVLQPEHQVSVNILWGFQCGVSNGGWCACRYKLDVSKMPVSFIPHLGNVPQFVHYGLNVQADARPLCPVCIPGQDGNDTGRFACTNICLGKHLVTFLSTVYAYHACMIWMNVTRVLLLTITNLFPTCTSCYTGNPGCLLRFWYRWTPRTSVNYYLYHSHLHAWPQQ